MNVFTEKAHKYDHCYKEHACTCIKCLEHTVSHAVHVYLYLANCQNESLNVFIALIGMVSRVSDVAHRPLVCEMFYKLLKTNTAVKLIR